MYDYTQDEGNLKAKTRDTVRTRASKLLLKIKRPRTEIFKKSLAYRGPRKWNELPEEFHHTPSKPRYKSMVTDWMCRKANVELDADNSIINC